MNCKLCFIKFSQFVHVFKIKKILIHTNLIKIMICIDLIVDLINSLINEER